MVAFNRNQSRSDGLSAYCRACIAKLRMASGTRATRVAEGLRNRYQMTERRYGLILVAQDGRCAGCGEQPAAGGRLNVDHDHACCPGRRTCGRCVRGLICQRCNVADVLHGRPRVGLPEDVS